MRYYIGIDLGTSSLKLLLVDNEGSIVNEVTKEYGVQYPKPNWSEQNPEDWWKALVAGLQELCKEVDKSKVAGIGSGGQMHGLVVLDDEDRIIRPVILWNDNRTVKETEYLNSVVGKRKLSDNTANVAFNGFTAPKLLWLKENEPQNFDRISKIMLPKDYLNYRLTGVHCTDYSDASGTLLLDVKNKRWSKEMLDVCSVTEGQMPTLYESYEQVGCLLPEVAKELGLSEKVIVTAGAGDNAAAAIGTGVVSQGRCNISLGTSGTVFISSETFSVDQLNALHSFCHADGGYHLMACILSAASCNKWFCDEILQSKDYGSEQERITDDMLGNNEVYFLPYLMGERCPMNDADACGTFTGLRMNTKRIDMVQAVLEGVAFALKDNIEIAEGQGINIESSCLCGGGAKSKLWQKIICNVLDIEINIPKTEQGPGYGGAILAMVSCGEYGSVKDCVDRLVAIKETIKPQPEIAARYREKYLKFKEIYPSMRDLFKKIK